MSGQQTILSGIFERSLSLDSKKNSADRAMSLWEDMAHSLDEIAANTKPGLARKNVVAHSAQGLDSETGQKGNRRSLAQKREIASPGKREKATSAHSILATPKNEGKRPEPRKTLASPRTSLRPSNTNQNSLMTTHGGRDSGSRSAPEHTSVVAQATDSQEFTGNSEGSLSRRRPTAKPIESEGTGKTKSQESLERSQNQADAKTQARTIADTLKQNLAKWDGSLVGDSGDAEEAAGLAAGGPVYAAVKEVAGALESKGDEDDSLIGALRKTIEDKTGVTAVKEKAASAKDGLKDRIRGWAGKQDAAQAEEEKAKRDKTGRFIRPAPNTEE